jgi:hypothetical protein
MRTIQKKSNQKFHRCSIGEYFFRSSQVIVSLGLSKLHREFILRQKGWEGGGNNYWRMLSNLILTGILVAKVNTQLRVVF